ncbi:MAG TPA: hypothetical protein IGS53_29725 [Leptolyngbyaceae cyanobacterium M33_DOE_097]|uniref:Uncharacterized protein n=1 Tax=Oscillatoriales cyanobacterium SpSt-418 TaxID=2282169 RepID=A0A7C3KE18_9CYAN|nr:hypothetical protein [Leptolyngbyaceae cyanobacterium M33_DOE_097]
MGSRLKNLQSYAIALLAGLAAIGTPVVDNQSVSATQQLFCKGQMNNGWSYTAKFLNGRFTEIRWERTGQAPQTTALTFSRTTPQGEPIYTGSFQAATAITLVDLSRGNVNSGSQITVSAEEWGTSTGTCSLSSGGNVTQPLPPASQQISCNGRMNNGWSYTAEYDRQFTLIRWQRSGQAPQTTTLTRSGSNAEGQPIYRGDFQSATKVTLVDLSRGNVRPGSEVSVGVEEWGWSRGRCNR